MHILKKCYNETGDFMNSFEKWFTTKETWVHILLTFLTSGIWLVIWLIVKLRVAYYNRYIAPANVLYEFEFIVEGSNKYQKNIDEIYKIQKEKFQLYNGMSTDDIKKSKKKVYESEGVKLDFAYIKTNSESKNGETIYHSIMIGGYKNEKERVEFEIGKVPKSASDEINRYKNETKARTFDAEFIEGNYKMVDSNNKVKLYKQPLKVKVKVKLYDKELNPNIFLDFFD